MPRHLEPEELALLALGEQADSTARDHLDRCTECATDLAGLAATVRLARAAGPDLEELVEPPAHVWDAIAGELELPDRVRPGGPATTADAAAASASDPTPRQTGRRRFGSAWLAVAAAAGIVVGGLGVGWWSARTQAQTVLEQASLSALPNWPEASGTAVVEEAPDGTRELVVTLAGVGTEPGYREVWLIDTGTSRLISLGLLHGDHGTFPLPSGLDLAQYPVVDISEEPYDGNPAHSGDSIVRGVLGA